MMRQTYPNLNAKGLLTAFVSCLLSGQVIADVAGRVNFVSGKVEAVSADGNRRNLVRGELVNSGERLETNSGRVQIRFTDGSFVSLQPNTVFGLDNYAFNKAQPNEGSLLFNFIRGSMRTVSGAIGKVNRGNYKVQTPVATIGIRGTSYAASQEPNGRLLLTVGKGIVNLQNDFGDSDINAGQTFQVETGKAPTTAPRGESVSARAKDPESKQQQKEESTGQNDNQAPNLADDNLVGFIQARDGIPRLSSFGSLLKGESGVQVYPNVQGFYSDVSSEGNANGRLLALTGTDFTGGNTAGKVILNTRNGIQSLNFSNVQQVGSLFLGAWTNGKASIVDPYIGTTGQLNLSALQFMPYVVGTTAEKNLGNHMTASYSLAGSLAKGLGTLTKLNIDIDLNLMPLVSVDMAAKLDDINYTATLNKTPLLDISFDKKFSGFILSAEGNGLYAQSSNASCANNQCPVSLSAFLSGETGQNMGVVYEIFNNQATLISGVAALSGSDTLIDTQIPTQSLASSINDIYSAAFKSSNSNISVASSNNLAAVFDSNSNGLMSAFHKVSDADSNNTAQDFYGALNSPTDPAAQTKDIGHAAKSLSWGRWTNGYVARGNDDAVILNANDNIHYLIGLPTASSALPTSGAVSYNLVGGTSSATFGTNGTDGVITAHDIGQVSSGNLTVDFNRATTQLSLGITGFSQASTLQSLDISGSGSLTSASNAFSFNEMGVSANKGSLVCTDCSASANGQFFGAVSPISQSTQVAPVAAGLLYDISGTVQANQATSIDVKGAVGFANPSVVNVNTGG